MRTLTPSGRPRSKALIEASHPRDVKTDDEHGTIFVSDKTPVEMAVREIEQLIRDNLTSNVSSRITPEMVAKHVSHNPISLWNFHEQNLRTCGQQITFEDAVRSFLKPVTLTLKHDGVYLEHQRYDSTALRATGLFSKVSSSTALKIDGYCLELCVRYLWVEVNNRIIEVEAQLPIFDDDRQLFMSLSELHQLGELWRDANADQLEHARAASAEIEKRFEAHTGKKWDSGKRRSRSKGLKGITQEARDIARHTHRRTGS